MKELNFEALGRAVFSSLKTAQSVGHKDPISTMRNYYKPTTAEMEFIYDLLHCRDRGGVDALVEKWCPSAEAPGQAFEDLIKKG